MPYFFRKKLKGQYYLFSGESRSDGKGNSVRVKSKYIGPYIPLCEYFKQSDAVILSQMHFEFGLSRALFELTKQLGMVKIFQTHISKRVEDPYLALRIVMMVINRLTSPCAKYSLQKWYSKSNLSNTSGMPMIELDSQKVYRTMDKLDEYAVNIETALCKVISAQENISFETIYLDFTNQETYSRNHDSKILDYGHNKHGMDDLYQVNISLCCDANSGIPLFHKSYPGNFNDKQFIHEYAKELRERLEKLGCLNRNLLVVDRGINGKDNFELLLKHRFDYIGGLIEREFPQYFEIPKSEFRNTYAHKRENITPLQIKYLSKINEIYGKKHKIIIFYNQENYDYKIEQFNIDLNNYEKLCEEKLTEFKEDIIEKTIHSNWNNTENIKKKLTELNKRMSKFFSINIFEKQFALTWNIQKNENEIKKYIDTFGKHVLFTNKTSLTNKQILEIFFNKDKIEKNFQFLKSNAYTNRFIVLGPMLHSKDERIQSHVYTCIMALQLYQIIRYRIEKSKINLTTQEALEKLGEITYYYTKIAGKEEAITHINPLTEEEKNILKAIQINIFD